MNAFALSSAFIPSQLTLPRHRLFSSTSLPSSPVVVKICAAATPAKAAEEKAKRPPRGITKPKPVSAEIEAVVGVKEIPRTQALKVIWAYIKVIFRKFNKAEDLLTKALIQAEKHFGTKHPKVGVVLTCIALMYKNKARMEASSGILIQEGLYRKAIDLLKAPALENEVILYCTS